MSNRTRPSTTPPVGTSRTGLGDPAGARATRSPGSLGAWNQTGRRPPVRERSRSAATNTGGVAGLSEKVETTARRSLGQGQTTMSAFARDSPTTRLRRTSSTSKAQTKSIRSWTSQSYTKGAGYPGPRLLLERVGPIHALVHDAVRRVRTTRKVGVGDGRDLPRPEHEVGPPSIAPLRSEDRVARDDVHPRAHVEPERPRDPTKPGVRLPHPDHVGPSRLDGLDDLPVVGRGRPVPDVEGHHAQAAGSGGPCPRAEGPSTHDASADAARTAESRRVRPPPVRRSRLCGYATPDPVEEGRLRWVPRPISCS